MMFAVKSANSAGLHDQLLDLFKSIKNKRDMEQYEQFLADEPTRQDFYLRLRAFSRCLHISLSSDKLLDVYTDARSGSHENGTGSSSPS